MSCAIHRISVLSFAMDDSSSADIPACKAALRKSALAQRASLTEAARRDAAGLVASHPFPAAVPHGAVVSGYWPMKDELDPRPLMRKLAEGGARLALPVIAGRGRPLTMRAFAFGDALAAGVWGIREPEPDAPEVFPDILLVPLAAFDRKGNRVGYGAGYYDRTIARLRAQKPVVAAGLAFSVQEAAAVPATSFDETLDFVLTEREIISCRSG